MANAGPHGFSEALYLYTSQTGNNGSAFAGITGNTLWYNTTVGSTCWSALLHHHSDDGDGGLAGGEEDRASLSRHLPDPGRLFVGLLVGVILIVGGSLSSLRWRWGRSSSTSPDGWATLLNSESLRWRRLVYASGCRSRR